MEIRAMESRDRHAIFERARELAGQLYPELKVDVKRLSDELGTWQRLEYAKVVVGEDGEAQGCLLARSAPNSWAQRDHSLILLWYSDLPGGGVALLRDFRRHVRSTRRIRVAGFVHDSEHMDPSMLELARRVGFAKRAGMYVLFN